jgi:hypothetical protein
MGERKKTILPRLQRGHFYLSHSRRFTSGYLLAAAHAAAKKL